MSETPAEDLGETPGTEIEESDPNADSAEGLAGEMGVSSERTGPVRGQAEEVTYGAAPTHLDEDQTEGEAAARAVGVRRPARGQPGVTRTTRVRPGLEPAARRLARRLTADRLSSGGGTAPSRRPRVDPLEDRLADVAQLLHLLRA